MVQMQMVSISISFVVLKEQPFLPEGGEQTFPSSVLLIKQLREVFKNCDTFVGVEGVKINKLSLN